MACSIWSKTSKQTSRVTYLVALGETLGDLELMFGDAADQVIRHADVERAADAAGQNVDVEAARSHLPPREYWVARSSRAMTPALAAHGKANNYSPACNLRG